MFEKTINAMRDQLRYWREECESAHHAGDAERIAQCERFIKQCEEVLDSLEQAQNHCPPI